MKKILFSLILGVGFFGFWSVGPVSAAFLDSEKTSAMAQSSFFDLVINKDTGWVDDLEGLKRGDSIKRKLQVVNEGGIDFYYFLAVKAPEECISWFDLTINQNGEEIYAGSLDDFVQTKFFKLTPQAKDGYELILTLNDNTQPEEECEITTFFRAVQNMEEPNGWYDEEEDGQIIATAPWATVTICKQNDREEALADWQVFLLGEKVATITIPVDQGGTIESDVLSDGDYTLVASGVYIYRGGGLRADANFSERKDGDQKYYKLDADYSFWPWMNSMDLKKYGGGGLGIQVMEDQGKRMWGDILAQDHRYYLTYRNFTDYFADGKFKFAYRDSSYSDNRGEMQVDIYQGVYTGRTGENGCVTIDNVPYGEYEVAEFLPIGWVNESGLGRVNIDELEEEVMITNLLPAPRQTGYNVKNEGESDDSYSTPHYPEDNEIPCAATPEEAEATNINSISVHWIEVKDGDGNSNTAIKYQRQYSKVGSYGWEANRFDPIYSTPYTNYRVFTNHTGVDGTYGSRVRTWVDLDKDEVVDDNEVSAWSNECYITYDHTAPKASIEGLKYIIVQDGEEKEIKKTYFVTNDVSPIVFGKVADITSGLKKVKFKILQPDDAHTIKEVEIRLDSIEEDGSWEYILPEADALTAGEYNLVLEVMDKAGNETTVKQKLLIDTQAPEAKFVYYVNGEKVENFEVYREDGKRYSGPLVEVADSDMSKLTFKAKYRDINDNNARPSGLRWDSFVIFEAQDDHSFNFSQNGKKAYCSWRGEDNTLEIGDEVEYALEEEVAFSRCVEMLPDGEYYLMHQVYDQATRYDFPEDRGEHITQYRYYLGLHFKVEDTTPPAAPSGLRRIAPEEDNKVYSCGEEVKIQRMWPDWEDNTEPDFDHYEYTSFNAPDGSIGLKEKKLEDSIFQYTGSWLPQEGTYGFIVRAVDKAGNKSGWAPGDDFEHSCQITYYQEATRTSSDESDGEANQDDSRAPKQTTSNSADSGEEVGSASVEDDTINAEDTTEDQDEESQEEQNSSSDETETGSESLNESSSSIAGSEVINDQSIPENTISSEEGSTETVSEDEEMGDEENQEGDEDSDNSENNDNNNTVNDQEEESEDEDGGDESEEDGDVDNQTGNKEEDEDKQEEDKSEGDEEDDIDAEDNEVTEEANNDQEDTTNSEDTTSSTESSK